MKKSNFPLIRATAQEIINRFGVKELPVNPFDIAKQLGITVCAKPPNSKAGISGALIRAGNNFGILYASDIPNPGFQNFTVAHEIGHFMLDGHLGNLSWSEDGIHYSTPDFHGDKYEQEADYFAACLLMPDSLFTQALTAERDGMEAIKSLVDRCKTSLTATAIRYADKTASKAVVLVSEKSKILYAFHSNEMIALEKISRLRANTPLPHNSLTHKINQESTSSNENIGETNMQDWFDNAYDWKGSEEVVRLGAYEKTLTLLTFHNDCEDILEEEEIEESWKPRFSR